MKRSMLAILTACLLTSCTGLDAGWRAQKAGNYDEAQKHAIVALAKDPKNPEVYQLVAANALAQGQYDRALKAAEFASSLDGGTAKSEQLVREAAHAKKDWKTLCDASLRALRGQQPLSDDDRARCADGYQMALNSPSGDGYGCGVVLESMGQKPDNFDGVKARYAAMLAQNGRVKEALEIEETVADESVSLLNVSRRLFALNRHEEATEKLRAYALKDNLGEADREKRLIEAAEVCEDYRRYVLQAELLSHSGSPETRLAYGIALRRSSRADEAEAVFNQYFEREGRDSAQAVVDVTRLLDAGYSDLAAQAYERCRVCNDVDESFMVADLLEDHGQRSSAVRILTQVGDDHVSDAAIQERLFYWYRGKHTAHALASGERAVEAGLKDNAFYQALLETYIEGRELNTYLEKSAAWLKSAEAPAEEIRMRIAVCEIKRKNWPGVLDVLKPLDEAGLLKDNTLSYYIQGLEYTRDYENLYRIIEKYKPSLSPVVKSEYFKNVNAEVYFRKCIEPLLNGSDSDKYNGELTLASYLYDYKSDAEAGRESLDRALKAGGYTSNNYKTVVSFLKIRMEIDLAVEYAKAWCEHSPNDENAFVGLGSLYLDLNKTGLAGEAFTKYVNLTPNKYQAMRSVFQKYTTYNEYDAGMKWLEEITEPVLSQRDDLGYRKALTESRYEAYMHMRSSHDDNTSRMHAKVLDGYRILIQQDPQNAMAYAASLSSLESWNDAADAYDLADRQGAKWNSSNRKLRLKSYIRAGRDDNDIKKVLREAESSKEVFDLADFMDAEQHPEYGIFVVESLLDDASVDVRTKAFRYLNRESHSEGDISKLKSYSEKLEKKSPDNADVRMALAEAALENGDWDEVVRHLIWLQVQRPDSREVLIQILSMARKAPDHADAQALLETTLEGSQGVYHRLDWISQYYYQIGDYQKAMVYAEQALQAAMIKDDKLEFRVLELYLKTGTYDTSKHDEALQLIQSLKQSTLWNVENLKKLSQSAQNSGYYLEAQTWMKEAIQKNPEQINLKQIRLEMALEAESEGQIQLSLEKAIEPPVAEVLDPLKNKNHILDIVDAVDSFEQVGEHDMSASAMLMVLPAYIQTRGMVNTRRALQDKSERAVYFRRGVLETLAEQELTGDSPCNALNWIDDIKDARILARLSMRCPDAQDNIFSSVRDYRSRMSAKGCADYDRQYLDALIEWQQPQLAQKYIEYMGVESEPYDAFERSLQMGFGLDAFRQLEENPVNAEEILDVIRRFVDYGYTAEALDYARNKWPQIPESHQTQVAGMALLLGAKDDIFVNLVYKASSGRFDKMDVSAASRMISIDILKQWLATTPSAGLGTVLGYAMMYARQNPEQKDEVLNVVREAVSGRANQVSVRMSVAQHALDAGFYEFALEQMEPVRVSLKFSDYVYRTIALAQAGLNQDDSAVQTLDEGARWTVQLTDYWERVALEHKTSGIQVRRHIQDERVKLEPRNPEALRQAAAVLVEAGDMDAANRYAELSYQYGQSSVASELTDVYEKKNALAQLPASVMSGTSALALELQARKAIGMGDFELAAQKYQDAALRSPSPFEIYQNGIEQMFNHKYDAGAEHLIAKWAKDWPHAYTANAYQAVYALYHGDKDQAWQAYETARLRSIDTNPWVERIVKAAAQMNDLEFAQRLYQNELSVGTMDTALWLESLVHLYLDEDQAKRQNLKADNWAKQGISFIEQLIPVAGYVTRNHEELRIQMRQLAVKAQRSDWIQRLDAGNL